MSDNITNISATAETIPVSQDPQISQDEFHVPKIPKQLPLNQDGSVSIQALTLSGECPDQDFGEVGVPRMRFTNMSSIGNMLSEEQTRQFWNVPASGWLLAALGTPEMFNEDTPQVKLPYQYLSLLDDASSLCEASWKLAMLLERSPMLKRGTNFVAIPACRVVTVPFDVATIEGVDLNVHKPYAWYLSGKLPDGSVDMTDEEIDLASSEARKAIAEIDKLADGNRPVWLWKHRDNSINLKRWMESVRLIASSVLRPPESKSSAMWFLHVSDIDAREFLLGPDLCQQLVELYDKTAPNLPYVTHFVRFERLVQKSINDDNAVVRQLQRRFNNHMSLICTASHCFSKMPFDLSAIVDAVYQDDTHKQMNETVMERSELDQLVEPGQATIYISNIGVPLFVKLEVDEQGKFQRPHNPASKSDFETFVKERENVRTKGYREGADRCVSKVKAELEKIRTKYTNLQDYYQERVKSFTTPEQKS